MRSLLTAYPHKIRTEMHSGSGGWVDESIVWDGPQNSSRKPHKYVIIAFGLLFKYVWLQTRYLRHKKVPGI